MSLSMPFVVRRRAIRSVSIACHKALQLKSVSGPNRGSDIDLPTIGRESKGITRCLDRTGARVEGVQAQAAPRAS